MNIKTEYCFVHKGKIHKFPTVRAARVAQFKFTGKIGPTDEIFTMHTPPSRGKWYERLLPWGARLLIALVLAAWWFGLTGDRFEIVAKTIGVLGWMVLLFLSLWLVFFLLEFLLDAEEKKE